MANGGSGMYRLLVGVKEDHMEVKADEGSE